MNKKAINVMVTDEYDLFKTLEGNRRVLDLRARRIIRSIEKVGYVINPIIVNEKYEVIDGQGRLEALKRLNLPVYYIMIEGIGIEECRTLNINQTNWGVIDYIISYADMGNDAYIYLLDLINTYGKDFNQNVVLFALSLKISSNTSKIKEGEFTCTFEEYERAKEVLSWLRQFTSIVQRITGRTECYYTALIFCYFDNEIDTNRLYKKMFDMQASFIPVITIQQALDEIEKAYNNRAQNKVYIKTNYKKWQDGKYSWYSAKYSDKYKDE